MTRWWFQFFPCLSRIPREMIWFDDLRIFFRWLGSTTNRFFLPPNKNPRWMRSFLCQAMFVGCFSISSMFSGAPWCWIFLGENILIGINSSNKNKGWTCKMKMYMIHWNWWFVNWSKVENGWTYKHLKMWFLIEHGQFFCNVGLHEGISQCSRLWLN